MVSKIQTWLRSMLDWLDTLHIMLRVGILVPVVGFAIFMIGWLISR
jgi:hypothetical protein